MTNVTKATLITADGKEIDVTPTSGEVSLQDMYRLIGCDTVELISLEDDRTMWIDEEGKFKPHDRNRKATVLLEKAGGMPGDYIAGNALIIEGGE